MFAKYKKNIVIAFIIIGVSIWCSHFFYSFTFGLYEDDYSRAVGLVQGSDISSIMKLNFKDLVTFPHGRPVTYIFSRMVSFVLLPFLGLESLYVFAFIIQFTASFIVYLILRKYFSDVVSVIGALIFALSPANTTKILLTNSFMHQFAMLMFIVALFFYLRDKKVKSYIFLTLSLLSYETLFILFLLVPLLGRIWNKKALFSLLKNAAVMSAILISFVTIRYFVGEADIHGVNYSRAFYKALTHMLHGPIIALKSFFVSPYSSTVSLNFYDYLLVIVLFGLVLLLLFFYMRHQVADQNVKVKKIIMYLEHLCVAYALIVLSYALSFTMNVFGPASRASRVHMAAALGVTLLFVLIFDLLLRIFTNKFWKFGLLILFISFIALQSLQGLRVQDDYTRQWREQADFWSQVVGLSPDLTSGTRILLVSDNYRNSERYIQAVSWSSPFVLRQIYAFPDDWSKPSLYDTKSHWKNNVSWISNDTIQITGGLVWPPQDKFKSNNTIILYDKKGVLTRENASSILLANMTFYLKPKSNSTTHLWKEGYLYPYLYD